MLDALLILGATGSALWLLVLLGDRDARREARALRAFGRVDVRGRL